MSEHTPSTPEPVCRHCGKPYAAHVHPWDYCYNTGTNLSKFERDETIELIPTPSTPPQSETRRELVELDPERQDKLNKLLRQETRNALDERDRLRQENTTHLQRIAELTEQVLRQPQSETPPTRPDQTLDWTELARTLDQENASLRKRVAELEKERDMALRENENTWRAHGEMFTKCSEALGDLKRALAELAKLREERDQAVTKLGFIGGRTPHIVLQNDVFTVTWIDGRGEWHDSYGATFDEAITAAITAADKDEPCTHDELDHGICLYCGEDRDPNSHRFGKKPNE